MLTKLTIRNFKKLDHVEIELGKTVIFLGPNNSGKTTALQALALWNIGVRRWNEKRGEDTSAKERAGVAINRKDVISNPVPNAKLFWRDLHVRDAEQVLRNGKPKPKTKNIRIDIIVDGITGGVAWSCGLEFDYANEESFYCRPLRIEETTPPIRMSLPREAGRVNVAFLPPMSGLAAVEPVSEIGRINVLIGEGQTAQVLRNLCYQIYTQQDSGDNWNRLVEQITLLFGVHLQAPKYLAERGEITMAYKEPNGTLLDLSSSGRGLQQTLLLLAYLYTNPNAVLLLDEPDAHLEILRQRQVYKLITDIADQQNSQIIAASHSEVVLNEAADRDIVIAFVGKPHRIDDRGSQALKALKSIGFDQYYQAEQRGWVLYLEGSTDLAILRKFAEKLKHPVAEHLESPFVYYVGNTISEAQNHFFGLREAKTDLVGVGIFDRRERSLPTNCGIVIGEWRKREIENYFCSREVLLAYARYDLKDDLFGLKETERRYHVMEESIQEIGGALKTLHKMDPWSPNLKVTDDFFDPLFAMYFDKLNLPNLLRKSDYYILAGLVPADSIDPEVSEKLDIILSVAQSARPKSD